MAFVKRAVGGAAKKRKLKRIGRRGPGEKEIQRLIKEATKELSEENHSRDLFTKG